MVTKRKEMKTSNMNKIYQTLLDEVDVGVHVINKAGKTIIYNKKMTEIESMESEDVLNKDLLEVFSFTDNQHSTLLQTLNSGKTTKNIRQTYFNNRRKEIKTVNHTFPIMVDGEIIAAVELAKDVTQLEQVIKENVLQKSNTKFTFDQIIGNSWAIEAVIEEAKRATRTSSSVLIIGETGTGKELFAQSIHNGSNRSSAPFIAQNCAAIPDNLMESILFGTKKGAFTGALDKPGLFEEADGGTLLLDEINSLEPNLQAKLLRVIQEKTIRRIGDNKDRRVDVRIIATMNESPIEAIANNHLRKDLYYRLSVVSLFIPPLRDREGDLRLLGEHFMKKYNGLFQLRVKEISDEAKSILSQHDWPGNVRELEHTIEGAMNLVMDEAIIDTHHLPIRFRNKYQHESPSISVPEVTQSHGGESQTLQEKMNEVEKSFIKQVLANNDNNISRAATSLGLSRQSLQYRLRKFGMKLD